MKKIKQLMAAAVLALALGGNAWAQPETQPQAGSGTDFRNMDPEQRQKMIQQFQNMDPQQMMEFFQKRIKDSFREQMGVTNDEEWAIIGDRISAVMKARMATMADSAGMMGGMRGGGGGGRNFPAMFGPPSPESQALQQAMDADAPKAQIQNLLAKLVAARKKQEATLAKAQEDLRVVLTMRQEAIAVLGGLLN